MRRVAPARARAQHYARDTRQIESSRKPDAERLNRALIRASRAAVDAARAEEAAERAAVLLVAFRHEHPDLVT